MTLTEEQRGALTRAIDYINETDLPVGELDGFDREVLRNMVTTAINYGPDVMKMIELLAAGEHDQWADWAQSILDSEPGLSDGRKAAWPEMIATPYENLSEELKDKDRREVHLRSSVALDYIQQQSAEIERLRAENEDLSKAVIDIQEERDLAQAEFRSYHRAWEEQAARVQELEEVLVEMVATNPCNIPTLCDVVHDELMCPALDGNCDFWKGCPQKNELREAARKQLQAEGKIGNGDHIAETDTMVPCWQITEERKAAIEAMCNLSTDIVCPACGAWIAFDDIRAHMGVLRVMLEANQ